MNNLNSYVMPNLRSVEEKSSAFHGNTKEKIFEQLFNKKFVISVPKLALMTDTDIERYGDQYDINNGVVDKNSLAYRTVVKQPVAEILRIFRDGYAIYTTKRADMVNLTLFVESALMEIKSSRNYDPIEDNNIVSVMEDFIAKVTLNRGKTVAKEVNKEPEDKILGLDDCGFSHNNGFDADNPSPIKVTTDNNINKPHTVNGLDLSDIMLGFE